MYLIFLDNFDRLSTFKDTYTDIHDLFEEKHLKIRGAYSNEAIKYIEKISTNFNTYQGLPNNDWLYAFSKMVDNVKSSSIFIYLEDHKLIKSKEYFKKILEEFEENNLDYLCYSWYNSSQLYSHNVLPLKPNFTDNLSIVELNQNNFKKLVDISGKNFYPVSLCSINSSKHLKYLLRHSKFKKIYNKYIVNLILLISYPLQNILR